MIKTLRIFPSVLAAREAGFMGPHLRDPDRPEVLAKVVRDPRDLDRIRGLVFDRVIIDERVIDSGAGLPPGTLERLQAHVRRPHQQK